MRIDVVGLILYCGINADAADGKIRSDNGRADNTTNRVLNVQGFMKRTKIVAADPALTAKLYALKNRMRVVRNPINAEGKSPKGPKTIDEAAEYLGRHINMAYPPSACTDLGGIFYFSGGNSTHSVQDFSSGFAIKMGESAVLVWGSKDKQKDTK